MLFFSLFRRPGGKWHEVRWRNAARDIYLAIQFAPDGSEEAPRLEKIPAPPGEDATTAAEDDIRREVDAAVDEYNRRNLCALKVGGIRYRANAAAEAADHGQAARKLLNLL